MTKPAQQMANKIGLRLHQAHEMEADALRLADEISETGAAQLRVAYTDLETAMESFRLACPLLGLNEGKG